MIKFNATIEFLSAQLAIVELHTASGEWAGSYRVDSLGRFDLYELGYTRASQEAALKGGILQTYQRVNMPVKIDGSKVRFWSTKAEAQDAARSIRWPVKCVAPVRTRFCSGYALGVGVQLDPIGGSFLSPQRFEELKSSWQAAA
jgi:hypothetical protein